jgi:hypothetical protein
VWIDTVGLHQFLDDRIGEDVLEALVRAHANSHSFPSSLSQTMHGVLWIQGGSRLIAGGMLRVGVECFHKA